MTVIRGNKYKQFKLFRFVVAARFSSKNPHDPISSLLSRARRVGQLQYKPSIFPSSSWQSVLSSIRLEVK